MLDVSKIVAYEQGDIGDCTVPLAEQTDLLELFQELVNTGLAWQLQGHYGKTAAHLIRLGYIDGPTKGGTHVATHIKAS